MFVIGIDPHRGSHTAAVLDDSEELVDELRVVADRRQRERLLEWAAPFTPRLWAIEGATGTGALLAQQLVAAGEHVLDVPPKLSARVRLLDSGRSDKTDSHDARSAAVVALRHRVAAPGARRGPRRGAAAAGQAPPRPGRRAHPGGVPAAHDAVPPGRRPLPQADDRAARAPPSSPASAPTDPVSIERKALARDLLAEVRRADRDLTELAERIKTAVAASGTTVTDVFGVGPDRRRLPDRPHRRHRAGSRPPGTTPATTAPPRSRPPADPSSGTGSTLAGTANSTTPSTWPR